MLFALRHMIRGRMPGAHRTGHVMMRSGSVDQACIDFGLGGAQEVLVALQ